MMGLDMVDMVFSKQMQAYQGPYVRRKARYSPKENTASRN
jgi:hypothetical protein